MKIYRGRFYLDEDLVTERIYTEEESDQKWLEFFKADTVNNPHPGARFEIETFEKVGETEVIKTERNGYVP